MKSKTLLLNYIEKNYNKLLILCKKFVGEELSSDLLNDLYLYYFERNNFNFKIENNEFKYIYISLRNLSYNNKYQNNNVKLKEYKLIDEPENTENEEKYTKILNILNKLYNRKEITWYDFKMFKLFYYQEYEVDIKNKTKKEVDEMRNNSLRKMEKMLDISHSSINYSVKKTLKKIQKELNL